MAVERGRAIFELITLVLIGRPNVTTIRDSGGIADT
jgi:hypothetical protein